MNEQKTQRNVTGTVEALGRRRHYRLQCDLETGFRFVGNDTTGKGQLVNIGLGGARMDFPIEVPLPAEVVLTLGLPEAGTRPRIDLELPARVVWTVADQEGGPYPTGVQWRELGDETRSRLHELLRALSGM
jgi:hypothetical protein